MIFIEDIVSTDEEEESQFVNGTEGKRAVALLNFFHTQLMTITQKLCYGEASQIFVDKGIPRNLIR